VTISLFPLCVRQGALTWRWVLEWWRRGVGIFRRIENTQLRKDSLALLRSGLACRCQIVLVKRNYKCLVTEGPTSGISQRWILRGLPGFRYTRS
jgi:hypothetical protein